MISGFLFGLFVFKGSKYDIQNINIAANNYLPFKDIVE